MLLYIGRKSKVFLAPKHEDVGGSAGISPPFFTSALD
jgi:hypothetical protein